MDVLLFSGRDSFWGRSEFCEVGFWRGAVVVVVVVETFVFGVEDVCLGVVGWGYRVLVGRVVVALSVDFSLGLRVRW